jgi:nicotinamide-nucleotide amidase
VTAEIISIGDELLIGQVINTNAAWLGEAFSDAGIKIYQVTTISDERTHILSALAEASLHTDLILITGGLGPTKDDITKETLCEFFNTRLIFNNQVFENINRLFGVRGKKISELNRKQAEVPEACTPIENENGTAPGMWFEKDGKIYISMPGVPYEMKAMITRFVIPELMKRFVPGAIVHKTIMTQGVPESMLAEKIEHWEDHLPTNVKLAYLPQPGTVRLRLTGHGTDKKTLEQIIEAEVEKLKLILPNEISGYDNEPIQETIGKLLSKQGKTLSTAESCTGGYIAHLVTSVPGSSDYFTGSIVAYANEAKESMLGVKHKTLIEFGAVSEQVVTEMANGARRNLKTDYSIAVSGIAGPGGATPEKPVGTTWIAIATPEKTITKHYQLSNNRERNIIRAGVIALDTLRRLLDE